MMEQIESRELPDMPLEGLTEFLNDTLGAERTFQLCNSCSSLAESCFTSLLFFYGFHLISAYKSVALQQHSQSYTAAEIAKRKATYALTSLTVCRRSAACRRLVSWRFHTVRLARPEMRRSSW